MAEIVNLRQARKAKTRSDAKARADANAARHGRSKAERVQTEAQKDLEARRLDAHQREDGDD